MFLIVHEVLHSYVEKKYNFNTVFNMFREVMPIYGELKLMDKFITQNQFIPEIIINWNELFDNLKHCTKNGLGDIIYKPSDKYYYIIGQLVAYYFFDIHRSDPEYCKHIVEYFCSNMNKYEPLELLNKIDLEIEELTSGELAKSMIKKYKSDYSRLKR